LSHSVYPPIFVCAEKRRKEGERKKKKKNEKKKYAPSFCLRSTSSRMVLDCKKKRKERRKKRKRKGENLPHCSIVSTTLFPGVAGASHIIRARERGKKKKKKETPCLMHCDNARPFRAYVTGQKREGGGGGEKNEGLTQLLVFSR